MNSCCGPSHRLGWQAGGPMLEWKLPAHWRLAALGSLMSESEVRARAASLVESEDVPVLSLTKNRGLVLQSERFRHRVATEDVSHYKVVRQGQVVYNPYVIWEGAIWALLNRPCGLVSPVYLVWNVANADVYFLDCLLRTPQVLQEIERLCSGVVQRRRSLSKEAFLSIEVPCPPLAEQRSIGLVLRSVQAAKEAREREIALERERKATLTVRLFTRGTRGELTKQTSIGTMPDSWQVKTVAELSDPLQYGLSLRGESTGTYPMLRMNNLDDGIVVARDLQYVELKATELVKFRLNDGDILFNRTNSADLVGKSGLFELDGDYVFASYLVRVAPKREQVVPGFLRSYLNWDATLGRLRAIATRGVSQSNISAGKLASFLVAVPFLEEQETIAQVIRACDAKITALERENTLLDELFRALLEELMTGRLSVAAMELGDG